jgi:hypothetical protein
MAGRAVVAESHSRPRPQSPPIIPLPVAEAPRRSDTRTRAASIAGNAAVPELSTRARPVAPLFLPERYIAAPGHAAASGPATPLTTLSALPGRAPREPHPAVMPGSKPAELSGAELERLADKIGRIIARRVAVERERRGR